jgi:UDP-N-acetylmuramoyl-tripeptide--D-alanyl-D-alanine ligase
MLKTILERQGKTHASPASFNNYLGVPLTLANIPIDAAYAVVEIGMNKPGEIEPLARMAAADVVLITAIGKAHLKAFGDIAGIAHEKAQIVKGLKSRGIAVLNADTPGYEILKKQTIKNGSQFISFGGIDSNLRAKKMQKLNGRIKVQCQFNDRDLEFIVGSSGFHFAENSLGVLLCVDCLGADIEKASQDLAKWEPSSGRGSFEKILLPSGNIFLIDDAFNANPSSMKSALQLLSQRTLNCSRRVAFLGDMLELGENEVMLHEEIISWPELADVDIIHTLGPLMHYLHKKLPSNIKGCHYESKNELISDLENILQEGDKVLVKSSKSVGLSSIVDAIRSMKK